jgi:hypothetical protein
MIEKQLTDLTITITGFIKDQKSHNQEVMTELATVKRGFYGDKSNLVKGMVDRQISDEMHILELQNRCSKLEHQFKHYIYKATGFIVGIEVIIWLVKQGIVKL